MYFFRFISFAIAIVFSCQLTLAAGVPSEYLDIVERTELNGERTGVRINDTYCPYGSVNCSVNKNVADAKNLAGEDGLMRYLMAILGGILNFVAIIAVILLIVAGIRLVTAMGDQEGIEAAKKHIIWTLGGLCVVILSLVIVGNITDVIYKTTDEKIDLLDDYQTSVTKQSVDKPVARRISPESRSNSNLVSCAVGGAVSAEAAYITTNEDVKFEVYQPDGTNLLISGIGHKEIGNGVSERDIRTHAQVMANFDRDLKAHQAPVNWPGYSELSGIQQIVLLDMAFHAGNSNIGEFTRLQKAIKAKDYKQASREIILNSEGEEFNDIYRDAGENMQNTNLLARLKNNKTVTADDIKGRATRNAYLMLNKKDAQAVFDAHIDSYPNQLNFLCKYTKIDWSKPDQQISRHFKVREVTLGDVRRKPASGSIQEKNILKLAAELDKIRDAWGGGIDVTSWYRPPDVNEEVGGAAKSQHLSGLAADIKPADGKISQFQIFLKTHWSGGLGTGAAKGFVHIDMRSGGEFIQAGNASPNATWTYPSA